MRKKTFLADPVGTGVEECPAGSKWGISVVGEGRGVPAGRPVRSDPCHL